jgi:mannan endo-1,4-beta-mannosidase
MTLLPLRVAPGGRYFETSDHQPFLFFGANDSITWPGIEGLFRRKDPESARRYLESLAQNGINTLRLMLEYSHRNSRNFETRVGKFNPHLLRLWDDLFALCEEFGLRVLLAPWDNFWMSRRWQHHPYNAQNGGPAQNPQAFFTDEATISAVEHRLRFVAQRWGGSGAFGAWDLFNEIHPFWGGSVAQQSAVIARWSAAIRDEECRTHGFTRPQTVSIFGPEPEGEYSKLIFEQPELDFASTHIYNKGDIDFPKNTVVPALAMARWTRYGLAKTPPHKPFTDSEHGPIHLFNDHRKFMPEELDDEYERHLMWAHLASGGCGSGMRWPARHPHLLTRGMMRNIGNMSAFARQFGWRDFAPRDATEDIEILPRKHAKQVLVFAVRDDKRALLWLLRDVPKRHRGMMPQREPLRDVEVVVRGLVPNEYSMLRWNTRDADDAREENISASADGCRFLIEELADDIAIAIQPRFGGAHGFVAK